MQLHTALQLQLPNKESTFTEHHSTPTDAACPVNQGLQRSGVQIGGGMEIPCPNCHCLKKKDGKKQHHALHNAKIRNKIKKHYLCS
jgi:hypothetical protein